MNAIDKLVNNLQPHVKNHEGKDCEIFVKVGDKTYRLTGGVSTFGSNVVLFTESVRRE